MVAAALQLTTGPKFGFRVDRPAPAGGLTCASVSYSGSADPGNSDLCRTLSIPARTNPVLDTASGRHLTLNRPGACALSARCRRAAACDSRIGANDSVSRSDMVGAAFCAGGSQNGNRVATDQT